jgi:hypothetical protein
LLAEFATTPPENHQAAVFIRFIYVALFLLDVLVDVLVDVLQRQASARNFDTAQGIRTSGKANVTICAVAPSKKKKRVRKAK